MIFESFAAMAMYPIGALKLNNTVPPGIFVALLFEKPNSEISISPLYINFDLLLDKSLGLIHGIPVLLWTV